MTFLKWWADQVTRVPFFGESEFNVPQAYGHACPPVIDNSECEQHEWRSVESFDGEATERFVICDRCGWEYCGD